MVLEKDGQVISLENENHVSAFLSSGWAEAKASAPAVKEEAKAVVKAEEKKPAPKKKQEK